jgi:hypothetical protein
VSSPPRDLTADSRDSVLSAPLALNALSCYGTGTAAKSDDTLRTMIVPPIESSSALLTPTAVLSSRICKCAPQPLLIAPDIDHRSAWS